MKSDSRAADNEARYPLLYFRDWPCQTVPLDEPVTVWADRQIVRSKIENLLKYLTEVDRTTLHLMWADFGCGKSHTLKFIEHLCNSQYNSIYPIYSIIPTKLTNFVDAYRSIIGSFNMAEIAEMTRSILSQYGEEYLLSKVLYGLSDFFNALRAISLGSEDIKQIGKRWLSGEREITRSEMKIVGVTRLLKNSDDAIHSLVALTQVARHSGKYNRLLLMIDEYQRLHEKSDSISRNINAGLHTYYNAVPRGLSILLSFSFKKKEDIKYILSDELRSREDMRSIALPEMGPLEASLFIYELLDAYRTDQNPPTELFPLVPDCIGVIKEHVRESGVILSPRAIIKRLDYLLEESRIRAENGLDPVLSKEDAFKLLSEVETIDQ